MRTDTTNRRLPAKPAFLALSCVGAFMTAPASANAIEGPTVTADDQEREREERDDIVVQGERYKELESPKYTAPLLDTPQTITVISDQIIRKQNLLTLRDALSTVPGITFGAGEGGGGYGDSINLRGQTANNDLQIDGVRDSAQYSRSDTFNLEQIEVINGANSVYGGSGSIGGTINLVSKRPNANNLTIVQGGVGTDDYYRATVDSNVRVSDLIAVRLNGMIHRNDVPGRDFDKYKRWGIAPSVKIGAEGPTSLTFLYVHQEDENTPQYGVPYYKNAVFDGPLPGVPDSGYYGYKNVDRQDQTIDQATIIFAHEFSDSVSIRNLTRWQRVDQDVVVDPPQGGTYCLPSGVTQTGAACTALDTYTPGGPRGTTRLSTNQIMYNQVDLRAVLDTGGIKHSITLGASAMQEDYDLSNGNSLRNPLGATPNPTLPPINISNPNAIYTGPINYIPTGQSQGDTRNLAAYLFDAITITDQFEINAGLRYENNRAKFRSDTIIGSDTLAGPESNFGAITRGAVQEANDDLFSYRVGLVFKPVANASLYAAYGNSRNPTSVSVRAGCGAIVGNTDPCDSPPEETVNYEVGGKIDLFGNKLQLTAAAFRNDRTNYRVNANDPALPSATLPVNDGRARVDGIALGASGNITKAWSIFANYTYLDTEIKQSVSNFCLSDAGRGRLVRTTTGTPPVTTITNPCGNSTAVLDPQAGQELNQTPKHSGSLFTTYTLPFGLQLGYGLTYQGSFALNNSGLAAPTAAGADGRANGAALTPVYRTDGYTTHRAFLSYPFGNGLTAQVNVQNFTNKRYFHSIRNNGWAVPGDKRSAVFSLYYSF